MKDIKVEADSINIREEISDRPDLQQALRSWRKKLSWFSIVTAVPVIAAAQTGDAVTSETNAATPPGVQNSQHMSPLMKNAGTPAFLRRQSRFLLPHQRTGVDISMLTGTDNCPGTPIPAGRYGTAPPYTDTGDTTGANNTVNSLYYYYGTYGMNGPDQVYSFVLTSTDASPEIRVTPTSPSYNPAIYILDSRFTPGCPAGTGSNFLSNWWFIRYAGMPGEPAILDRDAVRYLPLNVPLYLFVDSDANAPADVGGYTVRFKDVRTSTAVVPAARADFDSDGKTDLSVFRPSDGNWYVNNSTSGPSITKWGNSGDIPVPVDFDGDGKIDTAIYRLSTGQWFILRSLDGTAIVANWGNSSDKPMAGDFDRDGKADLMVYRPSTGQWFLLHSTDGTAEINNWGLSSDTPLVANFSGGNGSDKVIFRPSSGTWYTLSKYYYWWQTQFGVAGDKPVPADYEGGGYDQIAVYRPSEGKWYFNRWENPPLVVSWGNSTDIPVPGDYDGDGKDDIAVYRPSTGQWFVLRSDAGVMIANWGSGSDMPLPAAYLP